MITIQETFNNNLKVVASSSKRNYALDDDAFYKREIATPEINRILAIQKKASHEKQAS